MPGGRLSMWRQIVRTFRFVTSPKAGTLPKALALGALAYIIWPADLLPAIPFISWLDDAAVAWLAYQALEYIMRSHPEVADHNGDTIDTSARVSDDVDTRKNS